MNAPGAYGNVQSQQCPCGHSAATIHCRAGNASVENCHSAATAPTSPNRERQMVSTQPELPVRCCTIQAAAISAQSGVGMTTSAITIETAIGALLQ